MKRSASEQAPAPFFHMILVKWAVFVVPGQAAGVWPKEDR